MQTQSVVEGEKLNVGDKCVINAIGVTHGFGFGGVLLKIWGFKWVNGKMLIGLQSPICNRAWADLDGNVLHGHGLWIESQSFTSYIHLVSREYKIDTVFIFKNQNLKFMRCRILYEYDKDNVFVELDKNIGANSCDGLGKKGHCIILPRKILKIIK